MGRLRSVPNGVEKSHYRKTDKMYGDARYVNLYPRRPRVLNIEEKSRGNTLTHA